MNSYHGINNAADGTDRDGVAKYYSVENGPYGKILEMQALFYFPRFILYTCFLLLLIYGDLEVAVSGLGFSVDGVLGLLCEVIWGFWGSGSLYKHIIKTLGKQLNNMQVSESKQDPKVDLHVLNLIVQLRNQNFTKLIAKFQYQRNIWRCAHP